MMFRNCLAGTILTAFVFGFCSQTGCMPSMKEERVAKHRSSKEAAGRWTSVRGSRGQSSTSEYTIEGEKYEGLWEILNPIGGKAKLQMKLPAEWSHAKVYTAVENVFAVEQEQPWYYPIEEAFLEGVRRGLQSEEEKAIIPGACEDLPYDVSTTVIKRSNEYFIEMNAALIPGVE